MEKLFWMLYNSHNEKEISTIIDTNPIFQNPKNWKPYGNNKGNFGTFESQQNHPVPALIEKITNSIDAILIKECKLKGIDPKSPEAPNSMTRAVELFYNVPDGEIGELTEKQRRELAENIQILAVGDKKEPSIIIYDSGEGQNPSNFENSFLSLHRNNKTNIHFVQGKYNMGSTGAVVFCGENKYQLIGSKKCNLLESENTKFGFTLVRRHPLTESEEKEYGKSTWYEFFSPNNEIPSFEINELDLGLYNRNFIFGSIIKLYSYQLPKGSRSDITLDLWRDLNQYMFHLPLPISVYEKRNYSGKTPSKTVLGNRTRINIDSREKIETTISINISKEAGLGEIPIEIIIFKSNVDHGEFIKNKSLIFTQNGQVHGYEGQSFISQDLGFSLLKKYMLIHVDCTNIPTSIRQDLFMSNRTHLKQSPKTDKLKRVIISALRNLSELKRINSDRRNSLIHDSESDKELIETLLAKLPVDKDIINLLKKDGSLNFLKKQGERIIHGNDKKENQKKLNRFPSIFNINLKENGEGKLYKTLPINEQGKIDIETDVNNDYLFRPSEKGKFEIEVLQKRNLTDTPVKTKSNTNPNFPTDILTINREGPINGTIRLIIQPNEKAKVGDEVEIKATLSSPGQNFECLFFVKVDKEISRPKENQKKSTETFPNLPTPKKAFQKSNDEKELTWDHSELNWNGHDIVKVIPNKDGNELTVDSIIINMDSFALINFISKNKITTEKDIKFTKDKYFLSIYLHSLFLFSIIQKMKKDDDKLEPIEIDEFISNMIKPYASFLMYENHHITKYAYNEDF
ncbi:hypothetical protein [Flavobacterium alkalisoli]|uniref:hypothetical protein n=1 Tax=Flavobacterium alkalisoli TaxID=2602769 RepID=UPI003A8FEEF0